MVQITSLEVVWNTLDLGARCVIDIRVKLGDGVSRSLELWVGAVIKNDDTKAMRRPVDRSGCTDCVYNDFNTFLAACDENIDCRSSVADNAELLARATCNKETLPKLMAQHRHYEAGLSVRCWGLGETVHTSHAHLDGNEGPCHGKNPVGGMLGSDGVFDSESEVDPVGRHSNKGEDRCTLVDATLPGGKMVNVVFAMHPFDQAERLSIVFRVFLCFPAQTDYLE
jgi:hypothetical protein